MDGGQIIKDKDSTPEVTPEAQFGHGGLLALRTAFVLYFVIEILTKTHGGNLGCLYGLPSETRHS